MPEDVRESIRDVIMKQGEKSEEEAELYLKELDRTHRYRAETWS